MGTRSAIIMKQEDGYHGIYCHWDGYLSNNGCILKTFYSDPEKVKSLIRLGNLSCLEEEVDPKTDQHCYNTPEVGVSIAYCRDRGKTGQEAIVGISWQAVAKEIDHEYAYVFEDGKWTCNGKEFSEKENGEWSFDKESSNED